MKTHVSDAVIVGAGLAGERAAIEIASKGFEVHLISLIPPRQSHSNAAQGGIQASLGNIKEGKNKNDDDNWEIHFNDTVKGSDWGADQNVVEMVCKLASKLVREMEYWGAAFSRTSEGKINQRPFGGTSKPRCAFASDGTGHILLNTLDTRVMALKIPVFTRYQLLSLIHDNEKVTGITALNLINGEIEVFATQVVILATGGAGRLYRETTNSLVSCGDGCAITLETGLIPIGNPEAIQFHPTALVPTSILVTEGCRGDGGVLLDKDGKEFMCDYAPKAKGNGNLASRDVVSRSMMRHIAKGLGIDSPYGPHVWLDIKRLGEAHIKSKLADVDFLCRTFIGVDPTKEYIPVRPAQHYTMFGIKTNKFCEVYGLKRLFAAGECACWDMHGFNRLGGNSLLETVAAGYVAGIEALKYLSKSRLSGSKTLKAAEYQRQKKRLEKMVENEGKENVFKVCQEIQDILTAKVNIFRTESELKEAVEKLAALRPKVQNLGLKCKEIGPNLELQLALRLEGMLKLALCTSQSALLRTESRGSHYREDYPNRDDQHWLKRTLAYFPQKNDLPDVKYEPAEITKLPPGDRGYGEKK